MNILMSFKMAIQSILSSKFRSFLTTLGMIIGVAAVIILVNMVTAATLSMHEQLESMGTNLISVNIMRGNGTTRNVSVKELETLAEENSEYIQYVTPIVNSTVTVKYGNTNFSTSLEGVNEHCETIKNYKVELGRFVNNSDVTNRNPVVIIGEYVRKELFGDVDPLGEKIKINNEQFTIIGVLEQKSSSPSQGSSDDILIIPYSKATRLIKNNYITSFAIQATSAEEIDKSVDVIERFLQKKFKSDSGYLIMNQADLIDTIDDALGIMTYLMAGIAGISLIVGGIGIMNIMLVTVTERTREIGIRKAIGAKTGSILIQFLIESAVISCLGGLMGIISGVILSYFICHAMGISAVPLTEQGAVILGSFLFSAAIGIFFGLYPARKAAKLNPIEALRFE